MAFNLKRKIVKTASEESPKNREMALNEYNKDWSNTVDKESIPNLNGLLEEVRKEGNFDADETVEAQLDSPRKESNDSGNVLTDSQIDKRKSWFPHRQADHYDESIMPPINALGAAYDDKFHKTYAKSVDSKNNRLLDKDPGSQMSNEKTKVSNNVPASGSQLNNNPERFKDFSALKEADAALFSIYYKTASENRKPTKQEELIISQISEHKKNILASGFGDLPPAHPPHFHIPDAAHPQGDVSSSFYTAVPEQTIKPVHEPNDDDNLINELLGEPTDNIDIEDDINHPSFKNIHERERNDNKILENEDFTRDLF